jgi:hypothetical protein
MSDCLGEWKLLPLQGARLIALTGRAACGFLMAARGFCPFRTCGGKVALVAQMVLV